MKTKSVNVWGTVLLVSVLMAALGVTEATVVSRANGVSLTCRGIVWRTLRNGDQICPRSHSVLADVNDVNLRWSSWGGSAAKGDGFQAHDIFPHGRRSEFLRPIKLRLSVPKRCPEGRLIYSRFHETIYSHDGRIVIGRFDQSLPCDGITGGGNG